MRPLGLRKHYGASSGQRPAPKRRYGPHARPLAIAAMKARFLLAYAKSGTLVRTCAALTWPDTSRGLTPYLVKQWLAEDPLFAAAFVSAKVAFVESLEEAAYRRAVLGNPKYVYYLGEVVGEETVYSDTLLVTLLKANAPDKYRERVDITVDIRSEIARIAEEMGVSVADAEQEWADMRPRLLPTGTKG